MATLSIFHHHKNVLEYLRKLFAKIPECKETTKWIGKKDKEKVEEKNFSWVTDLPMENIPLGDKNGTI